MMLPNFAANLISCLKSITAPNFCPASLLLRCASKAGVQALACAGRGDAQAWTPTKTEYALLTRLPLLDGDLIFFAG